MHSSTTVPGVLSDAFLHRPRSIATTVILKSSIGCTKLLVKAADSIEPSCCATRQTIRSQRIQTVEALYWVLRQTYRPRRSTPQLPPRNRCPPPRARGCLSPRRRAGPRRTRNRPQREQAPARGSRVRAAHRRRLSGRPRGTPRSGPPPPPRKRTDRIAEGVAGSHLWFCRQAATPPDAPGDPRTSLRRRARRWAQRASSGPGVQV